MNNILLKISAVLWVVWGLVHAVAGILSMTGTAVATIQGIAAGVPPESVVMDYPDALSAILNQHGWNLFWAGAVTIVGAIFIWRGSATAIWVTALIGGLFDIGYFVFIDLGGYGTFLPGTLMTIFSASAIALSFYVWFTDHESLT
ncbi:MAG: hypothetical protein KTR21_01730 [Rhodobacteraceae bacterium]|nr:hypothetical protein [Paracoccaceae bacterium]